MKRRSDEELLSMVQGIDWEANWSDVLDMVAMSCRDFDEKPEWTKWEVVYKCCEAGKLDILLNNIPRNKWDLKNSVNGDSILHHACAKDNGNAFISLLQVVDANQPLIYNDVLYHTIQTATCCGISRNIELLLAAGFNRPLELKRSPLYYCTDNLQYVQCMAVLVSNCYRLKQENLYVSLEKLPQSLIQLEKSVIQCRDVIVVLLGLKKHRQVLRKLDRFLIQQELAVAIWSTRSTW